MDGLLTCAKYAFPPNLLKYCGPEDNAALFGALSEKEKSVELKNLLLQFEGAVPYLRLIAFSSGIKDIFDYRVVEAYWLGNELLEKVEMKDFYSHLENRFKDRMKKKDWSWLISGSVPKAKPFHAFHALDIYRRTGFLRSGAKDKLIETINNCSIKGGRVLTTDFISGQKNPGSGIALVEYTPIEFKNKKLQFGKKETRGYFLLDPSIKMGDNVSLHWDYVCDKITERQKNNLAFWTKFHLDLTNVTL